VTYNNATVPSYWLRWGLVNHFPGLPLNLGLPDLNLPSNWDYRCEPQSPVLRVLEAQASGLWMCTMDLTGSDQCVNRAVFGKL
jgi:hypothetical protein